MELTQPIQVQAEIATTPPALPSGFKASEFSLTAFVAVGGFAIAGLSMFTNLIQDSGIALPPNVAGAVKIAGVACGLGMVLFKALGYTNSRSSLKLEQLRQRAAPMMPQLAALMGQVVDLVKDVKSGGWQVPAGALEAAAALDDRSKVQLAAQLVATAMPGHQLAGQLAQLAIGVAGAVGDAKAAAVTTDTKAVKVIEGT